MTSRAGPGGAGAGAASPAGVVERRPRAAAGASPARSPSYPAITSAVLFKRALSYPFLQSINECGRPTPKEHSMVLADKPRVRAREERELERERRASEALSLPARLYFVHY